MTMSRITLGFDSLAFGALLLGSIGCASSTRNATVALSAGTRADCPGRMICSTTGKLICVDECTAGTENAARPDCPGQMICPLTGELICVDECTASKTSPRDHRVAKASCCSVTVTPGN